MPFRGGRRGGGLLGPLLDPNFDRNRAIEDYHLLVDSGMSPDAALNRVGPRIMGPGFQPIEGEGARFRRMAPLFAPRPGPDVQLPKLGPVPATGQISGEPFDVTGGPARMPVPFSPDREDRMGQAPTGGARTGTMPVSFSPDREHRMGIEPFGGGGFSDRSGQLAATGDVPNLPVLPAAGPADRSGEIAATGAIPGNLLFTERPTPDPSGITGGTRPGPMRRPTTFEVFSDPNTPEALLPDVLKRGPKLEEAARSGEMADAWQQIQAEQAANPGADPIDVMLKHLGGKVGNPEEFRQIVGPIAQLGRERAGAKRAETLEATEQRKRQDAEAARQRQAEADAYLRQEAAALRVEGDLEGARLLELGRFEDKNRAAAYAAQVRTRTQQEGATDRTTLVQDRLDRRSAADRQAAAERQAERLRAREREVEATRQARAELQQQRFQNQKALLEYRQRSSSGAGDPKIAGQVVNGLLREQAQIFKQITAEQTAAVNAELFGQDGSEHTQALERYENRLQRIDREIQSLRRRQMAPQGRPPAAPGTPPASAPARPPTGGFDLNRFLRPGATGAVRPSTQTTLDDDDPDEE